MKFPVATGVNIGGTTASMRSLYTADSVYFLFNCADPTESQAALPMRRLADRRLSSPAPCYHFPALNPDRI